MTCTKCAELFAECIPGAIIQAIAFVSGKQSTVALLSLASSILTAAFIAASISIEKDIDKDGRIRSPDFYGFVPLESRWRTVCVCLVVFVLCAAQVTAKVFAFALCTVYSQTVLAAYLVVDMFLMFSIKVARRDFTYWVPIDNNFLRNLASFLVRTMVKVITDYTGSPHFRHPFEMGGFYYSFTLISTPVVCFYFGSGYLAHVEDEDVQESLSYVFSSKQVYASIGALSVLQLIIFITLLVIIPSKYRSTFLSFKTGSQFSCESFQNKVGDSLKIDVFNQYKGHWEPIKSDVRVWLNERLPTWLSEAPEWFNDQVKSMIPDELVEDPSILTKIRSTEVEKIREK
jgi:hypothetical protein